MKGAPARCDNGESAGHGGRLVQHRGMHVCCRALLGLRICPLHSLAGSAQAVTAQRAELRAGSRRQAHLYTAASGTLECHRAPQAAVSISGRLTTACRADRRGEREHRAPAQGTGMSPGADPLAGRPPTGPVPPGAAGRRASRPPCRAEARRRRSRWVSGASGAGGLPNQRVCTAAADPCARWPPGLGCATFAPCKSGARLPAWLHEFPPTHLAQGVTQRLSGPPASPAARQPPVARPACPHFEPPRAHPPPSNLCKCLPRRPLPPV